MRQFGLDRDTVDVDNAWPSSRPWPMPGLCWWAAITTPPTSLATPNSAAGWPGHAQAAGVEFRHERPSSVSPPAAAWSPGRRPPWRRAGTADGRCLRGGAGQLFALLLRQIGLSAAGLSGQGYSATLTLAEGRLAPTVSLTDDERKLVFSRLGNRLRIAGTAEFNGYNLDLNPVRSQALLERTRQLFPHSANGGRAGAMVRPAPGHAVQRAAHRAHALWQPVAEHRPRHAGLDHVLRLGGGAGRDDQRHAPRPGFSLPAMLIDTTAISMRPSSMPTARVHAAAGPQGRTIVIAGREW